MRQVQVGQYKSTEEKTKNKRKKQKTKNKKGSKRCLHYLAGEGENPSPEISKSIKKPSSSLALQPL
jgi:hypothetical protein